MIDEYDDTIIKNRASGETTIEYMDVGQPCLARSANGLNRGVLVDMSMDATMTTITVFFVDTGELVECGADEVYNIPANLVEYVPYQAMRCRLFGIRPPSSGYVTDASPSSNWTPQVIDDIYERIQETFSSGLYAYVVSKTDIEHETIHAMDKVCYNVILLDYDWTNVNESVIRLKLAELEEGSMLTFDKMNQKLNQLAEHITNEKEEENWDNEISEKHNQSRSPPEEIASEKTEKPSDTIQLNMEELEEHMMEEHASQFLKELYEANGVQIPTDDSTKCATILPAILNEQHQSDTEAIRPSAQKGSEKVAKESPLNASTTVCLKYLYKRPTIYWRQTTEYIGLQICVSDNCKYNLEVAPGYLLFS